MKEFYQGIMRYIRNHKSKVIFNGIRGAALLILVGICIFIFISLGKKEKEVITFDEPDETIIKEEIPEESSVIEIPDDVNKEDAEDPQKQPAVIGAEVALQEWITSMDSYAVEGTSYGIDVAKYQGIIDWQQVKEAGIGFAMIRVGYRTQTTGVITEDPLARYNMQEAANAGIQIGVYFFSTALNEEEALEEAKWVTDLIERYPITYPVAYNCEGFTNTSSRQYDMTNQQRSDVAIVFLDEIAKQDYAPMFYASKSELDNNNAWDTNRLEAKYKIWVAQYPEKQLEKSEYLGNHTMWQYTNQGEVPGIGLGVDLNISYVQYSQTAQPKNSNPPPKVVADLASIIQFTQVQEQVTAKDITNLRTEPSTQKEETVVTQLKNGEIVTRTGYSNSGWSRVEYQGQTLYAVSSFLTTQLDGKPEGETSNVETPKTSTFSEIAEDGTTVNFRIVSETVTAKEKINLRSVIGNANGDTISGTLSYGETVLRVGIGDNGWSKLEVNGQTMYAKTEYLTTDLNYQVTSKPSLENPEANMKFSSVNEQVTPKIEVNLRSYASTSDGDGNIVSTIQAGTILNRTGMANEHGWSRIVYENQTLYAVTSYLQVVE